MVPSSLAKPPQLPLSISRHQLSAVSALLGIVVDPLCKPPWPAELRTPGATTTPAAPPWASPPPRPWRTCTGASSRRCRGTSPSSTATRTGSSTPPRHTKDSARSGVGWRCPPPAPSSSTPGLGPRPNRRTTRLRLSNSPFMLRTSTRASMGAIPACTMPMEDLFLKSLRRYSRSMLTLSLMPSRAKSCRRCSKQTGNQKTSQDGWVA